MPFYEAEGATKMRDDALILSRLEVMDSVISGLARTVADLEKRLTPVLKAAEKANCDTAETFSPPGIPRLPPSESEVAYRLGGYAARINLITADVTDLFIRLQV